MATSEAPVPEAHQAQRELIAAIAGVLDGVYEPCALARGQRMGLVSAGLVQCVRLRPSPGADGLCVEIHAATTSHSCMMYVYFEREVRRGLLGKFEIATIDFEWSFGQGQLNTNARKVSDWVHEQDAEGWSTWRPHAPEACADETLNAPARAQLQDASLQRVFWRAAP